MLINISILILIVLFGVVIGLSYSFRMYHKRQSYIEKFPHYKIVLEECLEKAFDMIYKDRIIVYSIEGVRPNASEFKAISLDYGRLVIKILGPNLTKEFIFLYGNLDTFLFNVMEYFNARSENDEIKEASIDKLMNQEET